MLVRSLPLQFLLTWRKALRALRLVPSKSCVNKIVGSLHFSCVLFRERTKLRKQAELVIPTELVIEFSLQVAAGGGLEISHQAYLACSKQFHV